MKTPRVRYIRDQKGGGCVYDRIDLCDPDSEGFTGILTMGRAVCKKARPRPHMEIHTYGNVLDIRLQAAGEQPYVLQGRPCVLHPGDLFVAKPYEPHGSGVDPLTPGVVYWMRLRYPGDGERLLSFSPEETLDIIRRYAALPGNAFHDCDAVTALWDRLIDIYASDDAQLRKVHLDGLFPSLVLDILGTAEEHIDAELNTSAPIYKAIAYIRENIGDSLSVDDLAMDVADLSPAHFKRRFKKEIGVGPGQYIARCRVAEAKRRLIHSHDSITDIAMDLGFATSQLFATVFKRIACDTPLRYRELERVQIAKHRLVHTEDSIEDIAISLGFNSVTHFRDVFKRFASGLTPRQCREQMPTAIEADLRTQGKLAPATSLTEASDEEWIAAHYEYYTGHPPPPLNP